MSLSQSVDSTVLGMATVLVVGLDGVLSDDTGKTEELNYVPGLQY